jgi:glycosyltransferase involved in cell wall biosynthesis
MNEPQKTRVSIVIPVYNEEAILESAIVELRERLALLPYEFEVIIAENGSKDRTAQIGRELAQRFTNVRLISVGEPNYGLALRHGILDAQGEYVLCDEIDLCDTDFHRRALEALEAGSADMIIGSKLIGGAEDERPFVRHAASIVYTSLLRVLLGFRGTDTHGLKAFRREALVPSVRACLVDKDVFASEMVIRAYRSEVRVLEIPIRVAEKRPPSINLLKRVPNVVKNLAKLTWAIRVRG